MKAFKCERCGSYHEDIEGGKKVATFFEPSSSYYSLDLCPDCQSGFDLWMEIGIAKTESEVYEARITEELRLCGHCKFHDIVLENEPCLGCYGKDEKPNWMPTEGESNDE